MALPKKNETLPAELEEHRAGDPETGLMRITNLQGGARPAISPARALQKRLHSHFVPEIAPVWTRFVTLFVAFALIGGWLSTTGAYTVV